MVQELVREFVPDAVSAGMDFSGLRRVNSKFHVDRQSAQRREGDVIWRVPTLEGSDICLYVLLEFQSESDWWMAARAQVYQGLLYQQVVEENKLKNGAQLPPVLLVVLYNGERRWNAPAEITELIALQPDSALWHWQPQVRYYVLDMGAFAGDDLARRDSLAALLFRLEQRRPQGDLSALIDEVIGWFREHPDFEPLKQLFAELIRQAIASLGTETVIPEDLMVIKSNLVTLGETWKQEWLAAGRAEGELKGRAVGQAEGELKGRAVGQAEGEIKGRAAGQATALVRLLIKRFGPLDPARLDQIHSADPATVERWFDRAVDAPDLHAVFHPVGE
ncbi:MAG: Rpn family recombination-promoting nuclease/putative transposase [Proteobacteria bacterium]|nr:Rpn family recombination-promoting nuclease/putative transposase [Pseudomonadota bacterium]